MTVPEKSMKKYRHKRLDQIVEAKYVAPGPRSSTRFDPYWLVVYSNGATATFSQWLPWEFVAQFEEVEP